MRAIEMNTHRNPSSTDPGRAVGYRSSRRARRRGMSLIYITAAVVVMMAFASLGVDLGRVQMAKTELQRGADAAARYGAQGLSVGSTRARDNAIAVAAQNMADGAAITLTNQDVQTGYWNSTTKTFTANGSPRNAVRVSARRTGANAIPLLFGRVVGVNSCRVTSVAIGVYDPGIQIDLPVPASSNPWLAGMPDGTLANPSPPPNGRRRDRAGPYTDSNGVYHANGESPAQLTGMPIVPGEALSFDAIAGTGQHGSSYEMVGPDGDPNDIEAHRAGAEHGKSSLTAPIDSVVAVFLDDSVPSGTPPANLDFTTPASREFSTLSPQLKQVFFVGDGRRSDGTIQQFVVPPGATRLYIGKMDGFEWNNNSGTSTVTIHRPPSVSMVK
jgi:Flp pilus assembly protein TadG